MTDLQHLASREYLVSRLVAKADSLHRGNHHRKITLQWEHQEICRSYLESNEITQDDYDRIISAMGGAVVKI